MFPICDAKYFNHKQFIFPTPRFAQQPTRDVTILFCAFPLHCTRNVFDAISRANFHIAWASRHRWFHSLAWIYSIQNLLKGTKLKAHHFLLRTFCALRIFRSTFAFVCVVVSLWGWSECRADRADGLFCHFFIPCKLVAASISSRPDTMFWLMIDDFMHFINDVLCCAIDAGNLQFSILCRWNSAVDDAGWTHHWQHIAKITKGMQMTRPNIEVTCMVRKCVWWVVVMVARQTQLHVESLFCRLRPLLTASNHGAINLFWLYKTQNTVLII